MAGPGGEPVSTHSRGAGRSRSRGPRWVPSSVAAGPPWPARGPQSAPDPTGRGPGVAHAAWGPQSSSSAFQGRAARRVAGQDPWARVWGPLGVVGLPGPRSRAPWAPPPATSGRQGRGGTRGKRPAVLLASQPARGSLSPNLSRRWGREGHCPAPQPVPSVSVMRATVSCGWRGRHGVTAASAPCWVPAALTCRPRAARAVHTRCREGGRGGRKGYPWGPAGLTPSRVPRECQARTAGMACRDWTARRLVRRRRPRREGGLRELGLPGLSTPSPDLPQGEAGRNGAPGEKGPNGLPVRARASFGARGAGLGPSGP